MSSGFNGSSESSRFRIHEIKTKGNTGLDVFVKYYDSLTSEQFVKEDKHPHIWCSVELDLEKYGYSGIDELLSDLKERFPIFDFEEKPYGSSRTDSGDYSARSFYSSPGSTSVVWAVGPRGTAPKFFLDEKYLGSEDKQIFIANYPDRFRARTKVFFDDARVLRGRDVFESYLDDAGLSHSGVRVVNSKNNGKFLEIMCEKSVLKKLVLKHPSSFRNFVFESDSFSNEKHAEELLQNLLELESSLVHVDNAKVLQVRSGAFDFDYKVRFFGSLSPSFSRDLDSFNASYNGNISLKKERDIVIGSREELFDPLGLSSPTQQLRDFFPSHSLFNPERPLSEQVNTSVPVFSHYKREVSEGSSELERAIDSAFSFYLKNSVVVDLEVTGYKKNSKGISGNVFMGVLASEFENKIYMTRKAWRFEDNKEFFEREVRKINDEVSLIFVDDEIDLIAALDRDVSKYEFVIGHNFVEYDFNHASKFNDLKKVNPDNIDRIRSYNTRDKKNRLWSMPKTKVLDTYKYVKNRIHILENYKLSSFGGFDKSLSYELMEEYINSGDRLKVLEVLNYTIADGVESSKVSKMLLRNAVLESVATSKPLSSVFSVNPVENVYDSGNRNYFMRLNTHRHRHDRSFNHHHDKLKDRENPSELIHILLESEEQNIGLVEGSLIFPKAAIEASRSIINGNHSFRFIYDEMLVEENPLLKADLLSKLHSFLHVPLDKVKNFMESAGLEFGKRYSFVDVFRTLNSSLSESEYYEPNAFGFSDFELARMNYIFSAEYRVPRLFERKGSFFYDYSMLHVNNVFSDYVENMKGDIIAKTQGFYVSNNPSLGFEFGNFRGLNFKDDGLVGRLGDYRLFLNRRRLSEKKASKSSSDPNSHLGNILINNMVDYFLDNEGVSQRDIYEKFHKDIFSLGNDFLKSRSDYLKVLVGFDLLKSRGTGSLF